MDLRWQQIEEIFHGAAELAGLEREAYLDLRCGNDSELRREVEALLSEDQPSDLLLDPSPIAGRSLELHSGLMIGPYRILGMLGQGGMGVVYRAHDTRIDRTVALKFGKTGFGHRFLREARAVSALNHPYVAHLYDVGEHEGLPYLVLEYVKGKPLHGPLPLAQAVTYAARIAAALEAAHAAGVVHRDLKPGNILITDEGSVKVLDFGLARQTKTSLANEGDTVTGMVAGTAAYMSPEQAEGRTADARSDIFALGCVLYEAITGRQAFAGKSVVSILAAVLEREPEPLTSVPEELQTILTRCLRKDPARRWQHAGDLRIALDDLCGDLASGARRERRVAPLHQTRTAAFAGLLLAAAALALWFWLWLRGSPAAEANVFTPVTDGRGQEMSPSLSPDGKTLLYAARIAGNWDIFSLRVGGANPVNLTQDSPSDDTEPAFAPNGERIAFRSERDGGGIFVMGATGESVRRLTGFCYLPAWSPDGREIACSTSSAHRPDLREILSSQIYIIDVATGERRLVSGIIDAIQPSWSPDGKRIAFWGVREGARDIYTVASRGGDVTPVTSDEAADWSPVWSPDSRYLYFSSDRGGTMNLWRVKIDTATGRTGGSPLPVNVPAMYAAGISFSRDGGRMAYTSWLRSSNLYLAAFDPASGRATARPRAITQGLKETLYPSISRDSKWIAFTLQRAGDNIAVVAADGGQVRRVTDDVSRDVMPRWSPDGAEIAFIGNRTGHSEVWAVRPDGSGLRQITWDSPRGGVLYPDWSPDGASLSYNLPDEMAYIISMKKSWREQQPRLVRVPVPAKTWFRVNDWSPAGDKLAGTIQRLGGGTAGIATWSPATRGFETITGFGQSPRWLPDGKRLLFFSNGAIWLADGIGKKPRQVLTAEQGSISPDFDVSKDGRLIVFSLELTESNLWIRSSH